MRIALVFTAVVVSLFLACEAAFCQRTFFDPRDIGKPIPYILEEEKDNVDIIPYVLVNRGNYENRNWIVSVRTGQIIGYAPWDDVSKRFTLLNLDSKYMGFVQATVGELRKPEDYTQYLRYDRDNDYTGVMIKSLGGRPRTPTLPFGELGGQLNPYLIGNLALKLPGLYTYVDVVRAPMGMDISVGGPK